MSAALENLIRELIAVQRAQIVELQGLRGDLRRFGKTPAGENEAALIRAIAAALGDRVFTSDELAGAAAVSDPLRVAIEAFGPRTNRQVGKALRRIADEGCEVAGLSIVRVGEANSGALWCVKADQGSHSHTPTLPVVRKVRSA